MSSSAPWPPTEPLARQQLLARLAHEYFVEGMSKVALAKASELSRFQVAALLQEAQDTGVVRIAITTPSPDMDHHLARILGVKEIVTVGTEHWPADRTSVARATAHAVESRLGQECSSLGISWSRTLQLAARMLPPLPETDVIQLAGALATEEAEEVPQFFSGLTCRSTWPLWAPLVVPDAISLKQSPEVSVALKRADDLDVAVFAIGGWGPTSSTVWHRVSPELAEQATQSGAVGEVSGHLLDLQGQPVKTGVADMVVAASLDQLAAANHRVATAMGQDRALGVLAAIRHGLVDTLVCDAPLRHELARLVNSA